MDILYEIDASSGETVPTQVRGYIRGLVTPLLGYTLQGTHLFNWCVKQLLTLPSGKENMSARYISEELEGRSFYVVAYYNYDRLSLKVCMPGRRLHPLLRSQRPLIAPCHFSLPLVVAYRLEVNRP